VCTWDDYDPLVNAANVSLPTSLPDYFPPAVGRYEVKPGLVRFGKPLGGGVADEHVFQIDATFPRFRANKLASRAERFGKYVRTHRLEPRVEAAVVNFVVGRLIREHPDLFTFDAGTLASALTGDVLSFEGDFELCCTETRDRVEPPYQSALDAVASQVQEDLAIVSTDGGGRHWLSALHVTAPNNWAPEEKIGGTFPAIHEPVAGMGPMNRQGDQLVRVMVEAADGLVRFAWGITWDDQLIHHPAPPPGTPWQREFDPARPRAFLRVERQTIWGFPHLGAALFTIRPYLYDVAVIRADEMRRRNLSKAIESMTPESRE
jgi:hypothetical protein